MPRRALASRPLYEELPGILEERGMSVRALARSLQISDSHLTRILGGTKQPTPELARRIADVLQLPSGFFIEDREGTVIEAVRTNPRLRDRIYRQLRR
jgi:transcriptional regulator with XRE-family HTH domain